MNQRIIYQNETGGVAIITPCDWGMTNVQLEVETL